MRLRTLTEQTVIFRNVQSDFVNLVVVASFFLVSTLQDFQVPLSSMACLHFKKALKVEFQCTQLKNTSTVGRRCPTDITARGWQWWPKPHFQTTTPLLFQNVWSRIRVRNLFKFENPTPVQTPATIDWTEIQQCFAEAMTFIQTTQTPATAEKSDMGSGSNFLQIFESRSESERNA